MRLAAAALLFTGLLAAQSGPTLSVDAAADRRPISPDIYGLNEYGDADGEGRDASMLTRYPITLRRWGGDNSVSYNWKLDSNNAAGNWWFATYPLSFLSSHPVDPLKLPVSSSFDTWLERSQQHRVRAVATVPIIGWTTKTRVPKQCSFSLRKYGAQEKCGRADWGEGDCCNGMKPDGKTPVVNDPNDVYEPVGPEFARDWVRHVVSRYGTARQGGVWLWELDNEPVWWHAVHRDIHPELVTFDEILNRGIRWAEAIKEADPTAMVGGPTSAGWESYFYSAKDLMAGWTTGPDWKFWNNPVDRNAHGLDFVPWYLREMRAYEQRTGKRLLDYLDLHAYVNPNGVSWNYDARYENLRMTSTRIFWDANYMPDREDMQKMHAKLGTGTPQIIPRFRRWVDEYYPGTKIAITEYNWGALDRITGAIAQADLLGIFGREGLDLATIWDNPKPGSPGEFVWRMFLNYDGAGNGFGETSVRAVTGDADQMSIFAAERSDRALTVLVLNKTEQERSASIALANFRAAGAAQVWSYAQPDLARIVRRPDVAVSGEGGVSATVPPLSMTLFVVPAAASGPVPVVRAVVDAAAYGERIAPGQMVAVFGENLAPETPVYYPRLQNPDMVATSLNGIRVLFNGVPGAVIATTPGQVNAVVPYVAGTSGSVAVQIERDGHRSAALAATLTPAAPAIFTASQTGTGQGAILNNLGNNATEANSAARPAAPGSIVSVFLTGEGLTDPPSVDGRLATTILPRPVLPVTAEVNGRAAAVHYAGAAPGNMAGLMQVNVEIPRDVAAGELPLTIRVGGRASQAGVTVAVR